MSDRAYEIKMLQYSNKM